ncbi:MAG TPA: heparan-alpha-glucosaminide N-acetyltransferase domain-containing protein [Vicinamibacterales bacterium]|nr:heparan-alpha-glucosaminide N-acetyltransferase domain-containing protein [Vicinamibacterales bacterium]
MSKGTPRSQGHDVAVLTAPPLAATQPRAPRLASLDIVRGAVMLLMAIDHVRVYSGLPAGGPTPAIFFTRWVTHFCAPAFVFLAGTGAYLSARTRTPRTVSRYLVTRGAWLVLLELTVIRVAWTFNVDFAHYDLAGVIWMLGWCMVLLAALVPLPTRTVAAFGIVVIAAQDVVGVIAGATPDSLRASTGWLWQLLYLGGVFRLGSGGPAIAVLYSIVPWIGVMAVGYAFGAIVVREPVERRRLCLLIGLTATATFVIVAGLIVLMNPPPATAPPALFRLLNQRKYPASQLFLLMTLGPTIALLPVAERMQGATARVLTTFGRVPLFYYLLHIPVIHAAAVMVSLIREGRVNPWLFGNHPMMPPPVPVGYTWSLPLLYLVYALVVAALYVPCAWFARVKAGHPQGVLKYL